MTWIGGILTKANMGQDELGEKLSLMARTACSSNGASAEDSHEFIISTVNAAPDNALMRVSLPGEGTASRQVYADGDQRLTLIYDGYLYGSEGGESRPSGVRHGRNGAVADSLVHLLAELPGPLHENVRQALSDVDGDYTLAVSDASQTVICRNSLGTRPLYLAEDDRFSAFASTKRPLWKIGLGEVRSLRAAMLAGLDSRGIVITEASRLEEADSNITDMTRAVDHYEQALCSAIRKRLTGVDHLSSVGVLLSGGVDSCLIAKVIHDLAPALGMEVIAYTVGLPDSPDVNSARRFAEALGMKHKTRILSVERIAQSIPEVLEAVEDSDFVQVETGIGICAAVDMAGKDGIRVLFSGQGADEQWGGYSWYPKVLGRDGREELCRRMWEDFTMADIETLDRENKIAMACGVDLFFPYLDREVVDVSRSVASELKVISEEDHLGKHPHRNLAVRMGIPEEYSSRGKLAIQHGTGIHGVLDEIARKHGFDPGLVRDIGYKNEEITAVRMGSSSRYGYRYAQRKLWQVPPHVQFFLHALAYKKGLLDRVVRERIGHFLDKADPSSTA